MAVQLAGFEPASMAEAARLNQDRGAAIIDINFGCPVKKIVSGHAGSALMRDEVHAARILEATVKAVDLPVTLKMRLGWDDASRNAANLARIAQECGIRMVTVHGRTRCQFYTGTADWKAISEVKEAVTIPVIANGDLNTFEDVTRCLEESQADGVMIGREAYQNPYLLAQLHQAFIDPEWVPPSREEVIQRYVPYVRARLAEGHRLRTMLRHAQGLYAGLPNVRSWRRFLSEQASQPAANADVLIDALRIVRAA